jgi:serine protease Do
MRLGVALEEPGKALADQLNLPRGEGLVVHSVTKGSAAEKAGVVANDILLRFAGKAVPSNVDAFTKMVNQAKADTPLEIVVLRKGKEQTLKGVTFAKQPQPQFKIADTFPLMPAGGQGVSVNLFRTQDKFNCRYQEGSLVITIHGAVNANNQAQIEQIHIQDGTQVKAYPNVMDVPAQYREKVNYIVEMVNKGTVQIQIQRN